MKKIILSTIISVVAFQVFPVFAQNASSSHIKKDHEVDLICMQNAIVKRENAVILTVDQYATAVKKIIETRRDALKAAWAITDKESRREALKTAWENDKSTRKTARKEFKKSKDAAWHTFKIESKVCKDNDNDERKNASHDDL